MESCFVSTGCLTVTVTLALALTLIGSGSTGESSGACCSTRGSLSSLDALSAQLAQMGCPASRLAQQAYISPRSPLDLPYISPTSPLHLPYISLVLGMQALLGAANVTDVAFDTPGMPHAWCAR